MAGKRVLSWCFICWCFSASICPLLASRVDWLAGLAVEPCKRQPVVSGSGLNVRLDLAATYILAFIVACVLVVLFNGAPRLNSGL